MDTRIQLVAGLGTLVLLVVVLDLVRRRRLLERYALLWLAASLALLGLAVWRDVLDRVASALGVAYPPNALFVVALGFIMLLLLHFSVAVSRLSDQGKLLAQRMALLEDRLREAEATARAAQEERDAVLAGRRFEEEERRATAARR